MESEVEFEWCGEISDAELVALTESYDGRAEVGWWDRIRPHSLGWVTARLPGGEAAGFVNVAWDGSDHAFLLDTKVRSDLQRQSIGTDLVRVGLTTPNRQGASGCTSTSKITFGPSISMRAGSG